MTTTPDFNWSDLQRSPVRVEKALAKHKSVRLLRRGDATLLLTRADEVGSGLVDLIAQLFAGLAGDGAGADVIGRVAVDVWPWLTFFQPKERRLFVEEFTTMISACSAVGEFRPLMLLVQQWQNTATAIAAGVDLRTPVGDGAGDVPKPAKRNARGRKK